MKRLLKRLPKSDNDHRAKAWSKHSNRVTIPEHQNPCEPCGSFQSRYDHDGILLLDRCRNNERIKDTGRDWAVTNGRGKDCEYFDKGKQTLLGEDF